MGLLKFPLLALLLTALPVFAAEDTAALIQKGAYVARAGDCEAATVPPRMAARRWPAGM